MDKRHKWRHLISTEYSAYYKCKVCGKRCSILKIDGLDQAVRKSYIPKLIELMTKPNLLLERFLRKG